MTMKTALRYALALPLCLLAFGSAFASFDMLLKIKDSDKVVARTTSADDGSFKFQNVPPGDYVLVLRLAAEPQAKGKAMVAADSWTAPLSIVSPRDAASGQATGKRMHKPMTIVKEWGAASPKLSCTVDGSTVSGRIETTSPSAARETR
jgi:hypothetical protein